MRPLWWFRRVSALLLFSLLFAGAADAQPVLKPSEPVQLALIAAGPEQIGLQVRLARGWKFYWRNPGEGGVPPRFDWSASRNLASAEVAWPAPRRITIGGVDLHGYGNEVVLPIALTPQRKGEAIAIDVMLEFGICRDICILREERLTRTLPPGMTVDPAAAELLARWQDRVPKPASEVGIALQTHQAEADRFVVTLRSEAAFERPDIFVEGRPEAWFGRPEVTLGPDRREAQFVIPMKPDYLLKKAGPLTLTVTDHGRAAELTLSP